VINVTIERKHVYLLAIIVTLAALLIPVNAWASNRFNDVPTSNTFHDDITWLADTGVTLGCGGGDYCPDAPVTRGQMAAFMHRFSTNQSPRAEHIAFEDPPDGQDLRLGTRGPLHTPAQGTIVITASGAVANFTETDIVSCWLSIDSVEIPGTYRLVRLDGDLYSGRSEICSTNGAVNLPAGAYDVEFVLAGLESTTRVSDTSLWAMWVPLNGSGNTPFVP
jgi:hypothetical protein